MCDFRELMKKSNKCIPYQTNRPENCPDTLQMSPLEYVMILVVEALPSSKFWSWKFVKSVRELNFHMLKGEIRKNIFTDFCWSYMQNIQILILVMMFWFRIIKRAKTLSNMIKHQFILWYEKTVMTTVWKKKNVLVIDHKWTHPFICRYCFTKQ